MKKFIASAVAFIGFTGVASACEKCPHAKGVEYVEQTVRVYRPVDVTVRVPVVRPTVVYDNCHTSHYMFEKHVYKQSLFGKFKELHLKKVK